MTPAAQSLLREFDVSLTAVEQALAVVNAGLAHENADHLEVACQSLQDALLACTAARPQWLKLQPADPRLRARLEFVRSGIAHVREGMARRAAGVQRALQILLPSGPVATYGRGAASFASDRRSDASFTSLSA